MSEGETCKGLNGTGCPFAGDGEQPLKEGFAVCARCEDIHFQTTEYDDREDGDNIPREQVVGRHNPSPGTARAKTDK